MFFYSGLVRSEEFHKMPTMYEHEKILSIKCEAFQAISVDVVIANVLLRIPTGTHSR